MLTLSHALGGSYVEGDYLRNAFRWKDTVGPWEERPGHFGDIWNYWTDDGFGFFEGLQVGFSFNFINSCMDIQFFLLNWLADLFVALAVSWGSWCIASVGV